MVTEKDLVLASLAELLEDRGAVLGRGGGGQRGEVLFGSVPSRSEGTETII
jgi:hypothetical protein